MEKLSSIFIGVVDFFAVLLPGGATVGILLLLAPPQCLDLVRGVGTTETAAAALLVSAYIVGQTMNALGGYLLDLIYDVLYDPRQGLLVGKSLVQNAPSTKSLASRIVNRWQVVVGKVHDWRSPLLRVVSGLTEKDTAGRGDKLKNDLDALAGASPSPGVYQRIRSYFSLTIPAAFEQIQRLESEQKFFRTATVAGVVIAIVARSQRMQTGWIWLVSLFFMTRYISKRRKTIERAYMLFGLRSVASRTAADAHPKTDD